MNLSLSQINRIIFVLISILSLSNCTTNSFSSQNSRNKPQYSNTTPSLDTQETCIDGSLREGYPMAIINGGNVLYQGNTKLCKQSLDWSI